ncbi:hypothetical protein TKK_0013572 [Trichogramma kaykai]
MIKLIDKFLKKWKLTEVSKVERTALLNYRKKQKLQLMIIEVIDWKKLQAASSSPQQTVKTPLNSPKTLPAAFTYSPPQTSRTPPATSSRTASRTPPAGPSRPSPPQSPPVQQLEAREQLRN